MGSFSAFACLGLESATLNTQTAVSHLRVAFHNRLKSATVCWGRASHQGTHFWITHLPSPLCQLPLKTTATFVEGVVVKTGVRRQTQQVLYQAWMQFLHVRT